MPYILILAGFVFLLYVISRMMKQSNSLKFTRIIRFSFAIIVGLLGFIILVRGNPLVGVILGIISYMSVQGSLWNFFGNEPTSSNNNKKKPATPINSISRQEALEILGLSGNPSPSEIKAAHHKLMLRIHPDQGGSDYFATKINLARDVLLD